MAVVDAENLLFLHIVLTSAHILHRIDFQDAGKFEE